MFNSFSVFNAPPPSAGDPGATIREAVRGRLVESAEVHDQVEGRVYPGSLPQKATLPAVTFFVPARTGGHNLKGSNGTVVTRVQISAWANRQSEVVAIAEAIRHRFDGFKGLMGEVEILSCLFQDEVDLPEPPNDGSDRWTHQIAIDYRISHRVSIPSQLS